MGKYILIGVGVLVLALVGGAGFLMVWDIPAPTTHVERVIPDAHFPH